MIRLKEFGKFFSGRSHAVEIVDKSRPLIDESELVFDFESVESFSQSFISELVVAVQREGINLKIVKGINFSSETLRERFEVELQRVQSL